MAAVVLSPTPMTPISRERTTVIFSSGKDFLRIKAATRPALPPPTTRME